MRQTPEEDRFVCDAEFVTDPPTPFRNHQWGWEAHARAVREAGFRTVRPLVGGLHAWQRRGLPLESVVVGGALLPAEGAPAAGAVMAPDGQP